MKITKVTPILVNRFLYVEVETDEGIKGVGESGAWGFLETSYAAVNEISRCLIGQDASRIQFLWNYMYRMFHFRGAAIMGALSAIDIALWDIAGKYHGVPVYQLLAENAVIRQECITMYLVRILRSLWKAVSRRKRMDLLQSVI